MLDPDRLRALFADPDLGWILDRLETRLRCGRPLSGGLTLRCPTPGQRSAVDRLLGRRPSRGQSLTLPLGTLEDVLRHGELAGDLTAAVEVLVGAVVDERARRAAREEAWNRLFADHAAMSDRAEIRDWLGEKRTRQLVRRYAGQDPERGRRLLERACRVLQGLPAPNLPLAELAARRTGDSHALDHGQPLATLVIPAVARLGGRDTWHDVEARRDAWASVGVLIDELSAPVLVLNLRTASRSLTGRVLELHARAGEPCRLTTRQLLRHPPSFTALARARVHVCENPAVVAAAAHRLGSRCAPLVCLEGQPTTAARVLLERLRAAGCPLVYHGDFDWSGVRIANLVMARHAARPWRFRAADYLAVVRRRLDARPLEGRAVEAAWDADLAPAMARAGVAVFEEQVIEDLLADL